MYVFFLIISVINVCLGFALAVYLEEPAQKHTLTKTPLKKKKPSKESAREEFEFQSRVHDGEPITTEEIPQEWLSVLAEENIVAESFVEATVQVLRLEVGRYRDKLIDVDRRVRECSIVPSQEVIRDLLEELRTINNDWLLQQADAAGQLSGKSDSLGEFEERGTKLEDILMDQTAQIETTSSNIDLLDFDTDMQNGCSRLIIEIRKLIDLAHGLRAQMYESLLSIMVAENRLETVDRKLHKDSVTGIHNRTGMEVIFHELWRDDPNRTRQHSCAMIDIDHFARLMESHGATICDDLLVAIASLLDDLIRKDRGFDVMSQYDGQRFFAFFGDTGPHAATTAIERIRQTILASLFEVGEDKLELNITSSVTEVTKTDTTNSIYDRLDKAIRRGKRDGRNQTILDEGNGPQSVDPPDFDVKGKILRI